MPTAPAPTRTARTVPFTARPPPGPPASPSSTSAHSREPGASLARAAGQPLARGAEVGEVQAQLRTDLDGRAGRNVAGGVPPEGLSALVEHGNGHSDRIGG